MKPDEYCRLVIRTEAPPAAEVVARLASIVRENHALDGLTTELGELADIFKRYVYYGKRVDIRAVKEELGDLLWYVGTLCNATGLSLEDVMAANIAKLRARYPDKFTEADALNRDLKAEMSALEESPA